MKRPMIKLWTSFWLALMPGFIAGGFALAQSPSQRTPSTISTLALPPAPKSQVSSSPIYARVITANVPVYEHPLHTNLEISPVRLLEAGYVWVTLANSKSVQQNNQLWYAINANEYVQADHLEVFKPSTFRGLTVSKPSTFAWIVFDAWTAPGPGEMPGEESLWLERYTVVEIHETEMVDERAWYRVRDGHWLEQGMVGMVTPKARPEDIPPGEKWIEVDLYEQTLAAYEGDRMVYATLISSGLPWWQTEAGLFQVWVKIKQAKMSGREGYPDYYFLEDVPWTMYFNREFSLHGAYWHDRFGLPHSHGCVNLSLADARWLFEWASPVAQTGWTLATEEEPGTWVWVHE